MVRTTVAPAFMISMAVAAAIMSGSGFTAWAGVGFDTGLTPVAEDLRDQARENVDSDVVGGALNLIGLAITAIDILIQTFIWTFLFPFALNAIGFPWWFAYPAGLPFMYVNLIGVASILRGTNIR